jgi:hypothetical protein
MQADDLGYLALYGAYNFLPRPDGLLCWRRELVSVVQKSFLVRIGRQLLMKYSGRKCNLIDCQTAAIAKSFGQIPLEQGLREEKMQDAWGVLSFWVKIWALSGLLFWRLIGKLMKITVLKYVNR